MRCRMRKQLFSQRSKVCDLSLILAIAGLLFVIVDAELTALSSTTHITKAHNVSIFLRSLAVLTTICLICCLINYHAIEVKIALIDSGADDWRVAVTMDRVIKLSLELAVCVICPFPGSGFIRWPFITPENRVVQMVNVPVDVLLSVPMFLRSYLLCRFMVLHSKQFQDAATRSIAALNRISMDFRFVIKTMMADHPLQVLVVFTVSYWICMSWMFTQCERYDGKLDVEHYYLNSMWFIMVTFMSIGYGDIIPNTYCGRTLSIATGIVGAGVSSALIAVISRKLELSRAEKHVNNFMADSKLTNQRKNAAASVLQETWFIHKYKKSLHKGDELRLRHHQRRFLHSINEFRRIKWDQRKLQEKGNSLLDVGKLHSDMHETLWEMHRAQDHFISQIDILTQKIVELQQTLTNQTALAGQPIATQGASCSNRSAQTSSPLMENPTQSIMDSNPTIPRVSVVNHSHYNNHGSLRNGCMSVDSKTYSQCQVDQIAQCPTGGRYVTVTTPLMHSFDEV
ncbi:calmodulin binding domain protein [Dictyocaulus viviparus]|uniref:Calmodulin binding domain protein n=1 Tax=Dictyocaulus viviparus TaxID=29172 RepID=A0A0D8Y0H9_DICVI|nr:calmodulin binding domain protein [Dictyocaulus viviparus]